MAKPSKTPHFYRSQYHRMNMKRILLTLSLTAIALAGCGGGGGSTNVFGGQRVDTYVTDTFRDDFDHVWVRIYRVVLNGPTPATLFDDPNGRVIDLRTLRDASGERYLFLDTAEAESAVYSDLSVTLDKSLSIVPAGANAAQAKQFSDIHDDAGKSTLRFSMLGFSLVSAQTFAVDFDLAAWTVEGSGKIRASIKRGDNSGITSQLRHEEDDFRGTVTTLTGASPDFTFTLDRPNGGDLQVKTNNKTRIFNESGAQSPTLANTAGVEVSGIFVGGNFFASSIKIEDLGGNGLGEIEGVPSNRNEAGGTFDVTLAKAHNFVPDAANYGVTTSGQTRYLSDTGATISKAQFFADLATAAGVEVEGNATANGQIDALKVRIDADASLSEVQVNGRIDTLGTNTFSMSAEQWFGFSLRFGDPIIVDLGGSTKYTLAGVQVTQAEFLAAVGVNSDVKVSGLLTGNTVTALNVSD